MTAQPTVTVIIPARNEMHRWPAVLEHLCAQTLIPDQVVVADGLSTDGSREWLQIQADRDPSFVVVDNPARIVPAALNRALEAATGDIVARMDTHADYAPDYLRTVVDVLVNNPQVGGVGGAMETVGTGKWGAAIAAVLRRPLGLGGARHRVGHGAGPAIHVFSGCYRREALTAVGGWDERLKANEDFEADVRVAASGAEIWLEPAARTTWYVRREPVALAKQMWRYGFYKALTLLLHPRSLRLRQLAPPALVIGLVVGVVTLPAATALAAASYLSVMGVAGALAGRSDGASPWRASVVAPVVHLSWGAGLVVGLVRFVAGGASHGRN